MYISSVFTLIRFDENTNKQNVLYQHKGLACHSVIIISHDISQFSTQCCALESNFIVSLIVKTNSVFFSVQNLDASNCLPLSHSAISDLYDLTAFNSQTSSLIHSITAMPGPQSSALLWSLGHVAHFGLAQLQLCQDTHSLSVHVYNVLFSSWPPPPPQSQGGMVVNRYLQNNPRST